MCFFIIQGIGLKDRNVERTILRDLEEQVQNINGEREILQDGRQKAKDTYEAKRKQRNMGEQSLFALAWEVYGFDKLIRMQDDICRKGSVG